MTDNNGIIYVEIDGQIWLLLPDGSLIPIDTPLLTPDVVIHQLSNEDIIQSDDGRISIIIEGIKHPILPLVKSTQRQEELTPSSQESDSPLSNEGREYFYELKRDAAVTIAESGFSTSHQEKANYPGSSIEETVSSKWHHRDGAMVSIVIDDNDYPIGLEGYINRFEIDAVRLYGRTQNIDDDRHVHISVTDIRGQSLAFESTVLASRWQLDSVDLSRLAEGPLVATATVTDSFDVAVQAQDQSIKDVLAEGVEITISDGKDHILDAEEAANCTLKGQFDHVLLGAEVVVTTVDGRGAAINYTTTLQADGYWKVEHASLTSLADGTLKLSASTVDQAGNPASIATEAYLLTTPFITIVAEQNETELDGNDGIINRFESPTAIFKGAVLNVADGLPITLTVTDVEGNSEQLEIIVSGRRWFAHIDVSTLVDGELKARADVTNEFADYATDSTVVALDQTADITVNVADDNDVINATEALSATIFGDSFDINSGQPVDILIKDDLGQVDTATATIQDTNSWSASGLNISSLQAGVLSVTANTQDVAGNPATATHSILYDPFAVIDDITIIDEQPGYDDDVINKVEDEAAAGTTFLGASHEIEANQVITTTITDSAGTSISGLTAVVAADGSWKFTTNTSSLVDGLLTLSASGSDLAGNIARYQEAFLKDTLAAITVEFAQDDNYINQSEQFIVAVSGTVSDIEDGQTVTVVISDGTIARDITDSAVISGGAWLVSGVDVSGLDDTALSGNHLTATATVVDVAGNPATATDSIIKDTELTIDIVTPVTGVDAAINNGVDIKTLKDGETTSIHGTSDAEIGSQVTVDVSDFFGTTQRFIGNVTDSSGNWQVDNVAITDLFARSRWSLTAEISDSAGNSAIDDTPALRLPEIAELYEFGSALGVVPSKTVRIRTSGDDSDNSDDYAFSLQQPDLTAITSAGETTVINMISQTFLELRTTTDELVLTAEILAADKSVVLSLHRNVDQPEYSNDTLVSQLWLETTQTDPDATTETVLSALEIRIYDSPPFVIPDYDAEAIEAINNNGNLLDHNTSIHEPARLFSVSVDTNDDGTIDTTKVVAPGGAAQFTTVKGEITFSSDGGWSFDVNRNLDHNLAQTLAFDYSMYDADGNPATGSGNIAIADGAQGQIEDSTGSITEALLGVSSQLELTFKAIAGSDNVDNSTVRFDPAVVTSLESMLLTSSNESISYSLSADGLTINAYINTLANTAFSIVMSAASVDSAGDSSINLTLDLLQPLDHPLLNTITLVLPIMADDTDGTDLLIGQAELVVNDGQDPSISTVEPEPVTETGDPLSPIIRTGSIDIDTGSDAIAELRFLSSATFQTLTSNGYSVEYDISSDGLSLRAYYTDSDNGIEEDVFLIGILATPSTGSTIDYQFSLVNSLDQIDADDSVSLSVPIYVIDNDDDAVQANINITIFDGPEPTITFDSGTIMVSEDPVADGSAGVTSTATTVISVAAGSDRIISELFDFTVGGEILDVDGNPLQQDGVSLLSVLVDQTTVAAYNPATGLNVLKVSVSSLDEPFDNVRPGLVQQLEVRTEVVGAIDHLLSDSIEVEFPAKVIDSDGDEVRQNVSFTIIDGKDPAFNHAEPIIVEEIGVGDPALNSEYGQTEIQLQAHSDNINAYSVDTAAFDALALTSSGELITLASAGNTYTATAAGNTVFTLSIDADGLAEMTLIGPFDHLVSTGNDQSLSFPIVIQAIDADADTSAPANITITIEDDVPIASTDTIEVVEGLTTTGNVFDNDHIGIDSGERITDLLHDDIAIAPEPGLPKRWLYEISNNVSPDVIGTFTVFEDGEYELVTSVFESFFVTDLTFLTYFVEDADGDRSSADIIIEIKDNGFVIVQPTSVENFEDSQFLLDMSFVADDVELGEVVTSITIAEDSLDGGTLLLNGTELVPTAGTYTLSGAQLDYSPGDSVVKPNGNLIYIPAEDMSNANDTMAAITPDADYIIEFTLNTMDIGGGSREFIGDVDLSVISVADLPEWQDNGSATLDSNGNVTRYIVNIDESEDAKNLNIAAISIDNDGSEDISYRLGIVDENLHLTLDGNLLDVDDTISASDITRLQVTGATDSIAGSYEFNLFAVSTEKDNFDEAETPIIVEVNITPVANKPGLKVKDVQTLEDQLIDLKQIIDGNLTDHDGSESLTLELVIPAGWSVVVDGSVLPDTTVIVDYQDLIDGKAMLSPAQDISSYNTDFFMQVTAIANESAQGGLSPSPDSSSSETKSVRITVKGVVDEPMLETGNGWELIDDGAGNFSINNTADNIALEDGLIQLNLVLTTTDIDGSEFSNILLSGLTGGARFTDASGVPAILDVVSFDSDGQPVYQVTPADLATLYLRPTTDFSGIFSFTLTQVITEPDGDSKTFDVAVNIDITPVVESGVEAPALHHFTEDQVGVIDLRPTLLDSDGSEQLVNVVLTGLQSGDEFIVDGLSVFIDASGRLDLADYSTDVINTLTNLGVQYQPQQDFSGRFNWGVHYEVLDTATVTGRIDSQIVDSSFLIDIHPRVEESTVLVSTGGTVVSSNGAVDLTGRVQFNEADIDGSEWLDNITIDLPNFEDFFVSHPNGAIHKGDGEWLIDAGTLTSPTIQDMMVEVLDGLVITSSVTGDYDVKVEARAIDQAPSWHVNSLGNEIILTDGKVISTELNVRFNEAVDDGQACTPNLLVDPTEVIDGEEDVYSTDIGSHLNTDISSGACDGKDDDAVSFRILASQVPHGGVIAGPGVVEEYDASGDYLVAWYFTESDLPTLQLHHLEEHFAGTMEIPVRVIVTDPSGDTLVDDSQQLRVEILPILDISFVEIADNIIIEEDSDTELGLYLRTEDSNQIDEGIESFDSSAPITLTLPDFYKGLLTLPQSVDTSQLVDNGNGNYTLLDPGLLSNLRFRPPYNMDGEFRLQIEGTIIDRANGYAGDNTDTKAFSDEVVINVEPVTDIVKIIQTGDLIGNEDTFIPLDNLEISLFDNNETHEINPELLPPGSSETITILFEGVPADSTFYYDNSDGSYTAAHNNGIQSDGQYSWKIDVDRADSLVFKPANNYSGDVELSLKVTNHEKGTTDYKTTIKPITIGVLPVADGSTSFANFDDMVVNEGDIIDIPIAASVIDDDSDGDETTVVAIDIMASSDSSAFYFIDKIVAPDGSSALFIDLGESSDPRFSARLEMTTKDLASIQIITNHFAQGQLDINVRVGSMDSNTVLSDDKSDTGGFIDHSMTININPRVDPPSVDASFDSIAGLEGESLPLALSFNKLNPAAGELGRIEISGVPAGYTIMGGVLEGNTWKVDEADIASAELVGATDLFGSYQLEITPFAELSDEVATGNPINIDVIIAEVPDTGAATIVGTASADRIYGNDDDQVIQAGIGADIITAEGGNDTIQSGIGSDHVDGGSDDDTIDGGLSDDILIGGTGSDTLTGGNGDDRFVFKAGDGDSVIPPTDSISDFEVKTSPTDIHVDTIDLVDFFSGEDVSTINKIDALIDLVDNGAGGTILQLKDSFGDINQQIDLNAISKDALYGGDSSIVTEAEILQQMIDDQTMLVSG
ncbi:T1SS-143 domain-containing protein [Sinobacterium caligoides]|uniref:T1SS-143 domain-containing protein n=1 Tax=Sinobacterium caligoides TaxID=933926 RepID=A0A3N2DJE3_9GAMM|nr:hypothetical protein [Sinobacterium caligoides]ROR99916.1 T1SS-143 domain-containing protein [Sinobacterium caligoides]